MMDMIIVGIILAVAAGYVVYRMFFRRSCGCATCESCGCGDAPREIKPSGSCGCGGIADKPQGQTASGCCGGSCNCGK